MLAYHGIGVGVFIIELRRLDILYCSAYDSPSFLLDGLTVSPRGDAELAKTPNRAF